MNDDLKRIAAQAIDDQRGELVQLAARIHAEPELAFEEFKAAAVLVDACQRLGLKARSGIYDIATAWEAEPDQPPAGPLVAFVSEYDALPEIGHACGHNIIATAPLGAVIGLRAVQGKLPGRVKLIGTPAEEGGGGKVYMGERGA